MATFVLSFLLLLLALAGIGIGLFFGRPAPAGSCGGLSCIPGSACAGCSKRRETEQ